jgi:hypothetical protein
VIPGAYKARTFIFRGTFDFVFNVDRTSIIADKRTGNLGMQACDESRVVRRLLTAAPRTLAQNPKIIACDVVSDPKSVASVCKSLCKNEATSARPLNIRKKMTIWVIYTGKIGQISRAKKSKETAKTSILSPLRLPFRHIGVLGD